MSSNLTKEKLTSLLETWTRFRNDETGQDLIEYALVACLVGLGAVATIKQVGVKVAGVFTGIGASVTSSI